MRAKIEKTSLIIVGTVLGILLSLNFSAIADKDTKNALPIDDLRTFVEIFGKIKTDYVEPVEDKKLLTDAINGMLTGLDPHSAYLDPEAYKELQETTQGAFGGLGIEVGMEDGLVKVVSPIEDTPAYKAGLKPGDLIVKLDNTQVKGLSLNDAVKMMRGAPGTSITLTIFRKGEPATFTVTLVRDVVKVQSVKYKVPEPGYGYARITQFQEKSSEDLVKAIKAMHDQNKGPFKGFVLDLRNNPGGLLNSAVGVSAAFLPKDSLVVYTEGRTKDAQMRLTASPENYVTGSTRTDFLSDLPADVKTMPMVVLVNGGSASASEIVSGALQDHKRAVIMGTQTFGKGSVQTILPMNNGAGVKLTTALYYTPNGRSIQAKGIVPDIVIEDPADPGTMQHEADLSRHFANPKGGEEVTSASTAAENKDKDKDAKEAAKAERQVPIEPASKNDYQFNQAMNLLKGLQIMQSNK